ncbi:MAG: hypothetical protein C5B55_02830 [Blastocatellia bacterium]|nr:MAG: hypothetical protein C5B55_02830 [Blastocatellia bacterium]
MHRPGVSRPRRLLLCLDGVPHELILAARNRGLFDGFLAPSRLLSPFPTMTNVALSAMFSATPPNGYESLYFDKQSKHQAGGIGKYLGRRTPDKMPSSYMDQLDYQEPLAFEFLIYVAPEKIWRADMRRFHEQFSAAPQDRDYFAFLKGTDGLLHAQGPARLAVALETLDKILREIREFCGRETEIVLFSDHGMNLEDNKRVNLATELRRKGFTLNSQLNQNNGRQLSIPAFGLCSYAAIYCGDHEVVSEVSDFLCNVPGIDFSVSLDEAGNVLVKGPAGSALIERRIEDQTTFYRYSTQAGDPLEMSQLLSNLRRDGRIDASGFVADDVLFSTTHSHKYPDALANVYRSVSTHRVKHTADVLVSIKDGYYYGWSAFARVVKLRATHGNALRQSSNAFLMSTHRDLPECIRADEAGAYLLG